MNLLNVGDNTRFFITMPVIRDGVFSYKTLQNEHFTKVIVADVERFFSDHTGALCFCWRGSV